MLSERDLEDLNQATRLLVGIIERHHVHDEDAADRRRQFQLYVPNSTTKKITVAHGPTLKEVNAMLVELKIKLKARQRADGRFEIRPTVGGKRKSIYGESAEELALKYRKMLKNAQPKNEKSSGSTLHSWLDEWLEVYKKPNVAENTYTNLFLCIRKHIKSHLPDKALSRFSMTELVVALNEIESTRMRQYARGILQAAFDCAVTAGKLQSSPAQNLPAVRHVSKKGRAFALDKLCELIENAAQRLSRELFLYYLFCLFAGTRRDEALSVTLDDCDFKHKIVHIPGTKTDGSDRRLPMFPALEKIIRATQREKGKLFTLHRHSVDVSFRIFRDDVQEAVLHWLRHTFGTIQICVQGIPANTVALWMGHADAATTMNIYTHPEDLAPDIYFSGTYSEMEKLDILKERYNKIISAVEKFL